MYYFKNFEFVLVWKFESSVVCYIFPWLFICAYSLITSHILSHFRNSWFFVFFYISHIHQKYHFVQVSHLLVLSSPVYWYPSHRSSFITITIEAPASCVVFGTEAPAIHPKNDPLLLSSCHLNPKSWSAKPAQQFMSFHNHVGHQLSD